MLKVDTKHPEFKQIVLASKGIGSGYLDRLDYLWQKQNYKNIEVATYTFLFAKLVSGSTLIILFDISNTTSPAVNSILSLIVSRFSSG